MVLPSSGAISLSDIAGEIGVNPATPLSTLSGYAGLTEPDAFSDFYDFQWVEVSWDGVVVQADTTNSYIAYNPINLDGLSDATIKERTRLRVYTCGGAITRWYWEWSINSTTSFTQISTGTTTTSELSYDLPTTTTVTGGDVLRLRIRVNRTSGSPGQFAAYARLYEIQVSTGSARSEVLGSLQWTISE